MRSLSALWLAALLSLSQASVAGPGAGDGGQSPAAPVEGMLLGLRSPDGLSTVLVDTDGKIDELGRGIAVPRPKGWWLVDYDSRPGESDVFAIPAPKRRIKCPPRKYREEVDRDVTVTFIGPNLLSTEEASREDGGAHSMESRGLYTRAFDSDERVSVSSILEPDQVKSFELRGEALLLSNQATRDNRDPPDLREWGIVRVRGLWMIRGALQPTNQTIRGTIESFVTDIVAPESVTALPQQWAVSDEAKASGVVDVYAPSYLFEVTISKDGEIRMYSLYGRRYETKQLMGQRRFDGIEVVMAQRVQSRKNLERWRSEARALLAQNPCRRT